MTDRENNPKTGVGTTKIKTGITNKSRMIVTYLATRDTNGQLFDRTRGIGSITPKITSEAPTAIHSEAPTAPVLITTIGDKKKRVKTSGNMIRARASTRGIPCNIGHTRSASNDSSSADSSSYGSCIYSYEHFDIKAKNKTSDPTPTKGTEIRIALPATETALRRTLLALFDSGTSSSLTNYDKVYKHAINKSNTSWTT